MLIITYPQQIADCTEGHVLTEAFVVCEMKSRLVS